MKVERAEVPWSKLRFESKSQSHQSFDKKVKKNYLTLRLEAVNKSEGKEGLEFGSDDINQ